MMILEQRLIEEFRDLNLAIEMRPKSLFVGALQITNEFVNHIREAQKDDQFLQDKVLDAMGDKDVEFKKDTTGYQVSIGMAPFEALYGRKCKTPLCWYDNGEAVLLGPEMLQQITEQVKLIREKIKASQDRQKSYYDKRRKPLDFQEGEHVFLKVSLVIGVGRALKSRKLTPKYLGPYQILKKVGPAAYQIALPPSLSNLHPVFHVSQLRRYNPDPSHVLALDEVQVKDNLTYKAQPQKITDRRMKSLRGKEIALVKVQWGSDEGDSTWELEDRVRVDFSSLEIYGCWVLGSYNV
ncbi:uncharacterized protein [Glycine max]|uniref:uncharacterized protein n=1 Tax=Glycine max TaxID=3847 RepID=UPI001B355217|nr:uncharacterized protein LOC121174999 [Glycine max]